MLETFPCPACAADQWRTVKEHRLRRDDTFPPSLGEWVEYVKVRRKIFFEIWNPGRDEVVMRTQYCGRCGFMTYRPRPSAEDLDNKYRSDVELPAIEKRARESTERYKHDRERGRAVFDRVVPHMPARKPLRVLDFGGNEGRLLQPFVDAGHDCALVDYATACIPGVRKLGKTLDDVPAGEQFDVVLCNHVVEHLADPSETIRRLAELLTPKGVLYAEVPSEIWRDIPVALDPVTHVNFFNLTSFTHLAVAAGLTPVLTREQRSKHGGNMIDVLIVIARRDAQSPVPLDLSRGVAQTRAALEPGRAARITHAVRNARVPTIRGAIRRLRRLADRVIPR